MSLARKAAQRLLSPIRRFLAIEAASGLVLLAATAVALVWASSPWSASYRALLGTQLSIALGPWQLARPLPFWINDGLMTIFFFVVGVEIRRDMHEGELSERRRALLPLVAAVGGMLVPALIFAAFNLGRAGIRGWGIPMATDIAFAVGILSLLGRRVAPAMRILLLALAVIDDIGAIVVIALFYSAGIAAPGLAVAAAGVAAVLILKAGGVRARAIYLVPGAIVWAGFYSAGIHPTLAGVVLGLLAPIHTSKTAGSPDPTPTVADSDDTDATPAGADSEDTLHRWVAFGIMPLFAFANAGVELGGASFAGDARFVFLGVALGLAVGKPLGILLAVRIARRAVGSSGAGASARLGLGIVGVVAGVGFTMALFIAQLAFPAGPLLETAKVGILAGSFVAALAGLAIGRALLAPPAS